MRLPGYLGVQLLCLWAVLTLATHYGIVAFHPIEKQIEDVSFIAGATITAAALLSVLAWYADIALRAGIRAEKMINEAEKDVIDEIAGRRGFAQEKLAMLRKQAS